MQISHRSDTGDWLVRRLNGVSQLGTSEETLRARALVLCSACVGLLTSIWFLVGFPVDAQSLAGQITVLAVVAGTATFLILKLFRTAYWPGMWFGVCALVAFAAPLAVHGSAAAEVLPVLILTPVIFGMAVSARISAIATGAACTFFVAVAVRHLMIDPNEAPGFLSQLLISAICTVLCGGLVAYFSFYREQENRKLEDLREGLQKAATVDSLTGVGNRRAFDQKLRELKLRANGQAKPALMLFDVDKFKLINDTHGHTAGDRVLIALAQRVEDILEDGQTLFRLGGDEFAVLFDDEHERKELVSVVR